MPIPVPCVAASTSPRATIPSVSGFGTRRTQRSIAAPEVPQPATADTRMGSKVLGSAIPKHRGDLLADRGDGHHRDDRYQHGKKPVFEQVLAVVLIRETCDGRNHVLHWRSPLLAGVGRRPPREWRPTTDRLSAI